MHKTVSILVCLFAWVAGAGYMPLTTIGPTTGWSGDASGSNPTLGAEFVINPILFVWGAVGVETHNRTISDVYGEIGPSIFSNSHEGFFIAPSVGFSSNGPFASVAFPILFPSISKNLYVSPYLRGTPWSHASTWEAGIGFKFILTCPQISGF